MPLPANALWQLVEGYITRWRIEDTIRHVKQSYGLEDIRLFKYDKIKAMASVLLSTHPRGEAWYDARLKDRSCSNIAKSISNVTRICAPLYGER